MSEIKIYKKGDDISCSHKMVNINTDPRSVMLLTFLKTTKETKKYKLYDNIWVIQNNMIIEMAKQESKNPELTALHYQDDQKDIIIVSSAKRVLYQDH